MTGVAVGAAVTIGALVGQALADYRDLCASEGIDPEADLAAARLEHGTRAVDWIAARLHAHTTGRPAHTGPARVLDLNALSAWRPVATIWALHANQTNPAARVWIAQQPEVPNEIRVALTHDPDPEVRRAALQKYRGAYQPSIGHLLHDPDVDIRVLFSHRFADVPELATQLAGDSDTHVRVALARDMRAPVRIITRLARDPDPIVRAATVNNRQLTRVALDRLHSDPEPHVRCAYASARRARPEHLTLLARDPDPQVRCAVANNNRTPDHILSFLVTDPVKSIRELAILRPYLRRRRRRR